MSATIVRTVHTQPYGRLHLRRRRRVGEHRQHRQLMAVHAVRREGLGGRPGQLGPRPLEEVAEPVLR
ncbi:hypothetical protein [Streptomyces sp. NPDC020489]|uniref:hypothetical protein n=1 Tax=Streptomyces sp. NPDC020489 TaxID=3365077 RepID=UPI0037B25B9E